MEATQGTSAGLRIAAEVRARIDDGRWPAGTVLPTELALAAEFAVSRPSVREALSALQFAGYVEPRRRRGTVVLGGSPVPGAARHVRAARTFEEVVDLLEARLVLEPAVLRLAAADPDPAALDEAHDAVAGMALVTAGDTIPADTDHRLHAAIAGVCRNPDLREQVRTLLERASGPVWRETQAAAWADGARQARAWTADHREVVAALARGDGDAAAAAARRHLLSAVDNAAACPALPPSQLRRLHRLRESC
ncbi:FadR/GntR family transcriptional regulator [Amycolatopsis nalaikhensis]|uniref:GntR family transcriptional regulator n=2 Tax=Amycolatopsis TaxID=1813 RepID=A0ABY8XI53_9PSEU|nr:FCD domain-containing protein [Amycolatopsis sp. 2-2]WIV55305.1 GntR family transcriptional regulator [Amycolatopsis sp. 2-2]